MSRPNGTTVELICLLLKALSEINNLDIKKTKLDEENINYATKELKEGIDKLSNNLFKVKEEIFIAIDNRKLNKENILNFFELEENSFILNLTKAKEKIIKSNKFNKGLELLNEALNFKNIKISDYALEMFLEEYYSKNIDKNELISRLKKYLTITK